MTEVPDETATFDRYAQDYDRLHAQSLGASGESPGYFAEYKARCLERLGVPGTARILDYGCGIGNLLVHLAERFATVHGYDPSPESLALARDRVPKATLHESRKALPAGAFDAVVLANVLHHVPPEARAELVAGLAPLLVPGGRLFVFEHNPYNPLTRRAVAACEFDADAVLLAPKEVKRLLLGAGLADVRLDFIVFFPRVLAAFRFLEPALAWLPAGAQTLTVATRYPAG